MKVTCGKRQSVVVRVWVGVWERVNTLYGYPCKGVGEGEYITIGCCEGEGVE